MKKANIYSKNTFDFCIDKRTIVRYNTNIKENKCSEHIIEQRKGETMSRVAVYRTDRELRSYRRKIRRQREIRRNIVLAVVAAAVLLAFAFSYHTITSFANTATENVSYKYFTSIQVEKGDTLWSIAEEYGDDEHYDSQNDFITEVMAMNNLGSEDIISGQYLIVPYYSHEFIQ